MNDEEKRMLRRWMVDHSELFPEDAEAILEQEQVSVDKISLSEAMDIIQEYIFERKKLRRCPSGEDQTPAD